MTENKIALNNLLDKTCKNCKWNYNHRCSNNWRVLLSDDFLRERQMFDNKTISLHIDGTCVYFAEEEWDEYGRRN